MTLSFRAKRLMKQGYAALDEGKHDVALRISQQLRQLRHTSSFELGARALWAGGKSQEAIALLKEGLAIAPQLYVLWEYLGCYYSDLAMFPEAHEAFTRGLDCPDAPGGSFRFNFALMFYRWGRLDDALEALEKIVQEESLGPPRATVRELRARILIDQHKLSEALHEARRGLNELATSDDEDFGRESDRWRVRSELCSDMARALWLGYKDRQAALEAAEEAAYAWPQNPRPFRLIRDIQGLYSQHAKRMSILFRGRWHEKDSRRRVCGFFIRYRILADNLAEAGSFARAFEPEEVWDSMAVEEWQEIAGSVDEPKGVCFIESNRILFPEGT